MEIPIRDQFNILHDEYSEIAKNPRKSKRGKYHLRWAKRFARLNVGDEVKKQLLRSTQLYEDVSDYFLYPTGVYADNYEFDSGVKRYVGLPHMCITKNNVANLQISYKKFFNPFKQDIKLIDRTCSGLSECTNKTDLHNVNLQWAYDETVAGRLRLNDAQEVIFWRKSPNNRFSLRYLDCKITKDKNGIRFYSFKNKDTNEFTMLNEIFDMERELSKLINVPKDYFVEFNDHKRNSFSPRRYYANPMNKALTGDANEGECGEYCDVNKAELESLIKTPAELDGVGKVITVDRNASRGVYNKLLELLIKNPAARGDTISIDKLENHPLYWLPLTHRRKYLWANQKIEIFSDRDGFVNFKMNLNDIENINPHIDILSKIGVFPNNGMEWLDALKDAKAQNPTERYEHTTLYSWAYKVLFSGRREITENCANCSMPRSFIFADGKDDFLINFKFNGPKIDSEVLREFDNILRNDKRIKRFSGIPDGQIKDPKSLRHIQYVQLDGAERNLFEMNNHKDHVQYKLEIDLMNDSFWEPQSKVLDSFGIKAVKVE